jgi:predicted HicB family RNase H-like nuclease
MVGNTWSYTMNIMTFKGHKAKIEYDPEIDMFRGEILGLNGGADFYGKTPDELRKEFKKSLKVYFDVCKEKGIEPYKDYSGKFNLRIPPNLHAELAARAAAEGKSLNKWVAETLEQLIQTN